MELGYRWSFIHDFVGVLQIFLCFVSSIVMTHLVELGCILICRAVFIYNHVLMSHRFMDGFILQLYVHGEKFNQPIFFCNNISGHVEPVRKQ